MKVSDLFSSSNAVALVAAKLGCDPSAIPADAAGKMAKELGLLPAAEVRAHTTKVGKTSAYVVTSAFGAGRSDGAAFCNIGDPESELTPAHAETIAKMADNAERVADALRDLADRAVGLVG